MRKILYTLLTVLSLVIASVCNTPMSVKAAEPIVIVIDPGHGGDNLGTDYLPIPEKNYNMIVAMYMKAYLEQYQNVKVYLTHTADVSMSLKERAQFAQNVGADFLFSLHFNASEDHSLYGAEVWIPSTGKAYSQGYSVGNEFLREFQEMGILNRGIKTKVGKTGNDYYGIIRQCGLVNIPAIIVEHCYVDHAYDVINLQSNETLREFGERDARAVAKYFGLSSASLGVDYSGEADALPEVSLQSILPATVRDKTEPDICQLTLQNADYETGEVSLEVTAADYDCPMMYYDYSTDGGRTYSELLPWPGLDIMAGTYPDTFTFSVTFTKGEQPVITVRGYNQADLFTESDPVTFAQPFIDQEKAAEEALQESLAAQEAAEASRAAEEQITEVGSSVITMADAAGNTPVPSEKSPEVNFGVFLVILLLVFLLYQIQQGRHRKRRRKNQSRKVSGDNRNHPR